MPDTPMRMGMIRRKPGQRWPGFCLLACLSCGVQAQVQGSGDYLARMDTDHDGRVSLPEYQDWMGYAFAGMDRDHDGVLAAAELPGGRGQPLTRSQHRERLAAAFVRQDRNGDGSLDARELAAPPR
jgi:Ca2+-binding EF-hand superfamily protein